MNIDAQMEAAERNMKISARLYEAIARVPGDSALRNELRCLVGEIGTLQAFTQLAWQRGTSVQEELDKFKAEVDSRLAARTA